MTRAALRLLTSATALWILSAVAPPLSAAQVVVLRIDPAAEPRCEELESALEAWTILPDPGYFAEARRLGFEPASDPALEQLTPAVGARLAVVPQGEDARRVFVEFRDGATGASLGSAEVPLDEGELDERGVRVLEVEVRRRIGPPLSAADPAHAEAAQAEPEPDASDETGILVRVFAGAGLGTRDVSWPAPGELRSVETGAFAALELGASFSVAFGEGFWLGPALAYQTSLAHEVEEKHISGAPDELRIRAHRFDAVLAASFQLGSGGFRLTPAVGAAVQNLRPEVHHLLTPTFSLAGPLLRITLRIPFGASVALRLAPEGQLLFTDEALHDLGIEGSGFAIGGELALEIGLAKSLSLELTARDARAWLPSGLGDAATDTGLFATTRLVWQP